jgi:hypothetical protein
MSILPSEVTSRGVLAIPHGFEFPQYPRRNALMKASEASHRPVRPNLLGAYFRTWDSGFRISSDWGFEVSGSFSMLVRPILG